MASIPLAWVKHELGLKALSSVTLRLEREAIPLLPVKGIVLGRDIYGDVLERPITDVDALIRKRDFRRAVRVAQDARWGIVRDSKTLGSVCFVVDGISIDVKSTVGPPGTCALRVEDYMCRAARRVAPLGFAHWHPELHDHTLLVAIDAFKDKLTGKPTALEDFRRLVIAPGFDSNVLLERAATARLRTMLFVVASWVASATGSQAWASMRDTLAADPIRHGYVAHYRRLSEVLPAQPSRATEAALVTRMVSDQPLRRLWALALGAAGAAAFVARHRSLRANPWL